MKINKGFQKISEIEDKRKKIKPPAYPWQDLALQIISELNIPKFKRNSVFKVCRDYDKNFLLRCMTDTKELCPDGEKWKYFFKLVNQETVKIR